MSQEIVLEKVSPPDREKLTVAFMIKGVQFAELNQETDRLALEIYPNDISGSPWLIDYDQLLAALKKAKASWEIHLPHSSPEAAVLLWHLATHWACNFFQVNSRGRAVHCVQQAATRRSHICISRCEAKFGVI